MIDLYNFDPFENMTDGEIDSAIKRCHERSSKLWAGEIEPLELVDLSDIYIDPSVPVPMGAPFALQLLTGLESTEAQVYLYSTRAFYLFEKSLTGYHITNRENVDNIMRKGLSRRGYKAKFSPGRGDTRGIFFYVDPGDSHYYAELGGINDPVIIEISFLGIMNRRPEPEIYKDSFPGDSRHTALYIDIDRIPPKYLGVIEYEPQPAEAAR